MDASSWRSLLILRSPLLRDLGAVLISPSLLCTAFQGEGRLRVLPALPRPSDAPLDTQAGMAWLAELDEREPEALHLPQLEELEHRRRTSRLGVYAAHCVTFLLAHCPALAGWRVAVGVQARPPGAAAATTGEFDVLLVDPSSPRAVLHLELSVKFLLLDDQQQWLGPHRSETLQSRLERMRRQLLLPATSVGEAAIRASCGLGEGELAVRSAALLRGWLFYPLPGWRACLSPGPGQPLSADHWRGWYTRDVEEAIAAAPPHARWLVLPKRCWLSPAVSGGEDAALATPLEADGLRAALRCACEALDAARIAAASEPPPLNRRGRHAAEAPARARRLLVAQMEDVDGGRWAEVSRGFLLESDWGVHA